MLSKKSALFCVVALLFLCLTPKHACAQSIPSGWTDADVGSVGTAGSASYANGVFTVKGAGSGTATADAFNYLYQPLSGDGTVVARVVSWQGGSSVGVGVTIRETLTAGSTEGFAFYSYVPYSFSGAAFTYRATTGGSNSTAVGTSTSVPYWVKLVRSGNTFTAYSSVDGVGWTQTGTSQTITMAQNVYIGLGVTSGSTSSLTTATFDNVSISTSTSPAPSISSVLPDGGYIGSQATISGSGFGATQGSSIVTLHDAPVTINSWSDSSITFTVPTGAVSGYLAVAVASTMNSSNAVIFVVGTQPQSGWMDGDIGTVGTAGSASYANGVSTVKGAGAGTSSADAVNFLYQPLSGDGTIIARVVSWQGGSNIRAGLMIRETLASGAVEAFSTFWSQTYVGAGASFTYRTSTDGSSSSVNGTSTNAPYWLKLIRSGSTFSAYSSPDGITWTQTGTSQTITMAQNVYVGLAVNSGSTSPLTTANFDNVSISTSTSPAPSISSVLPDGGYVGSQATISGSGFGATQGSSIVTLNDAPVTVNSWSDSSITFTVPAGAASGYLAVAVAPTMNCSNGVTFVVGSQPQSGWLDGDVGAVGTVGSASYSNGAFTVKGAGSGRTNPDALNFMYQPLSGDGAIVARLVNWQGGSNVNIGLMVRETLSAGSASAFVQYAYQMSVGAQVAFGYRATTDASNTIVGGPSRATPVWVELVRSGNTFSAYTSADGASWSFIASQSVVMAQNVYIGLSVNNTSTSPLTTATLDNVSVSTPNTPPPVITSLSISEGPVGTPVTISGHGFGATQGTNQVILSDMQVPVNSWSDTSINVTIPSGAVTGPMAVLVGPTLNASNAMYFTIASQITPIINSLSPNSNAVGGSVTLIGSGFGTSQGTSVVKFNGIAASTTSWDTNDVTAVVPQNATSGPVTLTLGSDGVTSNGVQFTVTTEHFTISGISPTAGQAGTLVTINGSGFGSNSGSVTFNGVSGSVVSWNDTAIIAAVPTGTSSGPVDVEGVAGPTFTVSTAITLTDSLSNQTIYTPTIAGGRWYVGSSQGSGCSTCDIRGTVSTSYDTLGNVLSSTDELNNTTSYTYDSNSNVTQMTQPTVQAGTPVTTYTYNSFGEVLTETDPLNHVTTNTYDTHGNLTSVTTPAPDGSTAASVTQFGYNSLGELTTITDPLNHVTTMTYNSAGLIATITDPQNNVTAYGYDSRGNRTSITDALSHTTTFTYDAGNRLTQIAYPDSTTTTFGYDYRGRRTSVTDQNNKTTTYAYDDADRLVTVTDAGNNVTTCWYDTESNLTGITDANSHTTNFTYDSFGRVIGTVFPSTASEAYTYDADNNLTSKTDRNGHTIQYVYDALNRLTEKDYPDTTKVEYTYDLIGKVLQVNDPSGTYGFSYDNMGRLTGTTANYSFLSGTTFTNSYAYDAASNRTGYTAPDGSINTYSYDTLNRLTNLANSATGSFGFSYDALSRRTQLTRPNGIDTNYTYDSLSRLLSVLHQSGTSTIDGDVYTLDAAGNRTAKTDDLTGVTSNYTYDALYELTQVTQGSTTTESYSYDPVGNRTASLGIPSYTTNSSNELTSDSNASYTYDNNGNTLTKTDSTGATTYAWDYDNRLLSVTLPNSGGTVTFKYDPMGRRIYKQSADVISIFVYDGASLVETVDSGGGVVARYTHDRGVDEPLAISRGATLSFYEADGVDSVTSLSDRSGALAQTYTYDSFGKATNSSGSLTNSFQYTARDFDGDTNLYYNRARYYDSETGRFISPDPIGSAGGSNAYAYVDNDPVEFTDPMGLKRTCKQQGDDMQITPWWTSSVGPWTWSPWVPAFANGSLGGSDTGPAGAGNRGVGFGNVDTCFWTRTGTRSRTQSALFIVQYLCCDPECKSSTPTPWGPISDKCIVTWGIEKRTRKGTQTTTQQVPSAQLFVPGDSETYDDIVCGVVSHQPKWQN